MRSRSLDPSLEKIIEVAIKDFYLRREKPPLASLHREVHQACHKAGATPPSYKAIQSRVRDFDPREVITRRLGPKQAAHLLSPVKAGLYVKEPLQLLQIDHTLVDIVVVDEFDREPIGRPWLTLAIDVATRMVPGFYLSLEAPSATSVAMALNMAVLPKNKFLAAQHIDFDWPCQGLPKAVHLDNAREFHSKALKRGCEEHGIEITFRPPGRPHFGGHIERLIGPMMGEVHLLPGTTFSSVAARGDYKPADTAVITMRELERWLTLQITGIYHRSLHRGLGRSPQQAWNQAMMFSLVCALTSPASAEGCPPLFGWFTGSTAQSDFSSTCMSPCGLWPSRTGLDRQTKACWRSPGSRACCFSACAGSQTTQDPTATRDCVAAVLPSSYSEWSRILIYGLFAAQ